MNHSDDQQEVMRARSAVPNQAPSRARNSLKTTNIANELLNASNSRVRTFHPVLELHLPEIVMDCCGSESPDCKIVIHVSRELQWLREFTAPAVLPSPPSPQVLANWL